MFGGIFLDLSSLYPLRQGFSLSLELAILASLANQLAPESSCSVF